MTGFKWVNARRILILFVDTLNFFIFFVFNYEMILIQELFDQRADLRQIDLPEAFEI